MLRHVLRACDVACSPHGDEQGKGGAWIAWLSASQPLALVHDANRCGGERACPLLVQLLRGTLATAMRTPMASCCRLMCTPPHLHSQIEDDQVNQAIGHNAKAVSGVAVFYLRLGPHPFTPSLYLKV